MDRAGFGKSSFVQGYLFMFVVIVRLSGHLPELCFSSCSGTCPCSIKFPSYESKVWRRPHVVRLKKGSRQQMSTRRLLLVAVPNPPAAIVSPLLAAQVILSIPGSAVMLPHPIVVSPDSHTSGQSIKAQSGFLFQLLILTLHCRSGP
ncbi:hypothetical protein LY76DRAFT_339701 [Colletotrichum caudatum]|nr:hypothetical protein LY76DRAFT_339701 [Colletotrichum caudatum]